MNPLTGGCNHADAYEWVTNYCGECPQAERKPLMIPKVYATALENKEPYIAETDEDNF
jgi:hypothetical protein